MIIDHWMLQGKGGVSKTVNCSFLAQFLRLHGLQTYCFDTDPVNPTFTGYEALHVERINLLTEDNVDPRKFDPLVDRLVAMPQDSHAVIDNGASSFLPICSYLLSSNILGLLEEKGHSAYLHTVLTGGQAFIDTLKNLGTLCTNFPNYPIIVWLCLKDGDLEYKGTKLEDTAGWKECLPSIHSVVPIPNLGNATFGVDLQNLFSRRQTFAEAAQDESLGLVEQHRLLRFWDSMCEALNRANILSI